MYEQGERLAIISDEGGILETMGGLYSNGAANVDILLKGIDGGYVRTRRNARTIDLNPYMTMILAIQPAVIQNMSEKRAFRGNGTMERFLFTRPTSKLGFRTHDKASPPSHVVAAYQQKVGKLLAIAPLIENGQEKARLLSLSPESWEEWRLFQNKVEKELRPGEKLSPILGFGGKICGYALRIAGLLHVAEYELTSSVIAKETIERALEIATLLIEHALVVNRLISTDPAVEDAKEVYHWIMRAKKPSFTQSEVIRAMKNRKCGKSERLGKALQVLVDRNIIGEQQRIPTKKPTYVHQVNPQLLKG